MRVLHSLTRRGLMALAAIGLLAGQSAVHAQAGKFPDRPVKLIVTYPPGGSSDLMARVMGQKLSEIWGQPVIIESKPGAAGSIGMEFAARQANDGYTFVIGNLGPAGVNPLLQKLPYNMEKDFIAVSLSATGANILVVPVNSPYKSVKDIVADAKANPGKVSFGTSGPGSMSHLAAELLMRQTGTKMVAIPYKGGGQAVTDVLSGQLPLIISDALPVSQHIASGKLRALAITSEKRSPLFPDIPTLKEVDPTAEVTRADFSIWVPKGTPKAIIGRIRDEIAKVASDPAFVDKNLVQRGLDPSFNTPEQFAQYLKEQKTQVDQTAKKANLQPQ